MQKEQKLKKDNFFTRLKYSLLKTRENMGISFINFFYNKKINNDLFNQLEEKLLVSDVGLETTRKIIYSLRTYANYKKINDPMIIYNKLREEMVKILSYVDKPIIIENKIPYVLLIVGINGSGKTTTVAKLAYQYKSKGKSVMLAAGDTFRAAAIEQLQTLGSNNNIPVIAQHIGSDPASVIFDAIYSSKAKGIDVLIVDTAGRLQNKIHLMEELKKIIKVMKKLDQKAPHEVILILDSNTGQNSINQVKIFHESIGLTGIILTKLDGTAKGGIIFSIANQFKIPIPYIGIGEGIDDLRPFIVNDFIEALFIKN
ncbi:MAG: hypothetical protein ArsCj_5010 [Arsenophonus endosymbiont of Ceratovacuna japonica]